MVSFKSSPFSKLIELSRLYSEHAVQILTSIAIQFLDSVIKDSKGFCVPLRTLKIVTSWYTASFTLLVTRTAELVIQFNWLNGQRALRLSSFLLRPQCNGHQVALLRPQRVGWHNGHQATLLGWFVLWLQRVSWHNGQATLLGWFDLRPQRVSSIKHGEPIKTKHDLFDVQGPKVAHTFLRLW